MRKNTWILALALLVLGLGACKPDEPKTEAKLVFKFRFDSTQLRLDNFGQVATIPAGNAAQSPRFRSLSAHYLELAPLPTTQLGEGAVLFHAPEVSTGGATAIDFAQNRAVGNGEVFFEVPIKNINPGDYRYIRLSLAYQNYDIDFVVQGFSGTGTVASFVGYNTYIGSYRVKEETVMVNANKRQGYFGFEYDVLGNRGVVTGESPAGATTVPNPLAATSPVPPGSCVVTGAFVNPQNQERALSIRGDEVEDIVVTVSVSINRSFEWRDTDSDGRYNPQVDSVVDMGLRGLIPFVGL